MEETWNNFWQSGKVTDYLSYKNTYKDEVKDNKERRTDVAKGNTDGDGSKRHAHWGI